MKPGVGVGRAWAGDFPRRRWRSCVRVVMGRLLFCFSLLWVGSACGIGVRGCVWVGGRVRGGCLWLGCGVRGVALGEAIVDGIGDTTK